MAAMKIYGHWVSQPSRAVLWFCKINSIPFDFERRDPVAGECRTPEFLALSPAGQIPVLVDGDLTLGESNAILPYLSDKFGLKQWYPTELKERAKVDQWLHWHHSGARLLTTELFRPHLIKGLMGKDIGDPEKGKKRVARVLKLPEGQLAQTKYLASRVHPTIADIAFYSEIDQMKTMELLDFSTIPNISRWMADMATLPHHDDAQKTVQKLKGVLQSKM
eukprot:GFYU01001132.1.p1 GENE.GFYU01001132.1~~GFYU01001132.1.p1  ORF type:complete len:220 (-),score=62.41 GFYU01001132.1:234-893(-)